MNNTKRYLSTMISLSKDLVINYRNICLIKRTSPTTINIFTDIQGNLVFSSLKLVFKVTHHTKESSDEYFNDLKNNGSNNLYNIKEIILQRNEE